MIERSPLCWNIIPVLIFLFPQSLSAKVDSLLTATDTMVTETYASQTAFRPTQLVLPLVLMGFGAWGLADGSPVDWVEKRAFYDMNTSASKTNADEYLQYVPTGVHLILGTIPGVKTKHNFRDRLLASVTAHMFMAALTNCMKYTIRERRPDSTNLNSFPSGHTATAFTGAELMRIEYGWGYGSAAYMVATVTAFLRVWNKEHWVGDVLAGAGVGIFCANAGYWMLPVWHRWFGIGNRKKGIRKNKGCNPIVVCSPFYIHEEHATGLSCSLILQ